MVKPSFYKTWWRRVSEVEALQSLDRKLAYARANTIDYVIENLWFERGRDNHL